LILNITRISREGLAQTREREVDTRRYVLRCAASKSRSQDFDRRQRIVMDTHDVN